MTTPNRQALPGYQATLDGALQANAGATRRRAGVMAICEGRSSIPQHIANSIHDTIAQCSVIVNLLIILTREWCTGRALPGRNRLGIFFLLLLLFQLIQIFVHLVLKKPYWIGIPSDEFICWNSVDQWFSAANVLHFPVDEYGLVLLSPFPFCRLLRRRASSFSLRHITKYVCNGRRLLVFHLLLG